MLIEGWAPAFSQVEIEAYLNDAHVYYEITDPMPGDNVPIRLNNKDSLPGSNRSVSCICFRSIMNWT